MTDERLNSPWLPDWRALYDDTDMSPKARRVLKKAIDAKTQEWEWKHEESYRDRFRKNRDARQEKVFDVCDDVTAELQQIRKALAAGRITPAQARAKLRDAAGQHEQVMEIHDTLVQEDEAIEEFAGLTADDYQRQSMERFPALANGQPTLAAFAAKINPPPPPGGALQQNPNFVPTYDAPSPEDLTVN